MNLIIAVEQNADIDTVASAIKGETGFGAQVLRGIRTIIITGPDGSNQSQILEKIRKIDGVRAACEDAELKVAD